MKRRTSFALILILCLLTQSLPAFSQPSGKHERVVGRVIGTVGGAVGGAFLGFMVSDDDAVNATQKSLRNIALLGVAGAVGGYFLGRAVDKSFSLSSRDLDPLRSDEANKRLISSEAARFRTE